MRVCWINHCHCTSRFQKHLRVFVVYNFTVLWVSKYIKMDDVHHVTNETQAVRRSNRQPKKKKRLAEPSSSEEMKSKKVKKQTEMPPPSAPTGKTNLFFQSN